MSNTLYSLFAILPIISFVYIFIRLIYSYFFSPLSGIPNASWTAPISRRLWTFFTENQGKITLVLPGLHEKYGPLVRVGPNELSFYSLEIYKLVHSPNSGFAKEKRVYSQFVQNGHPALFSITDPQEHAKRRRIMGQIFNRSRVPLLENLMLQQVERFISAVKNLPDRRIEAISAIRALDADIMSAFGFGTPIGGIKSFIQGTELNMVKANDDKASLFPLYTNFPHFVQAWLTIESVIYDLFHWRSESTSALEQYHDWSEERLREVENIKEPPKDPIFMDILLRSGLPPLSVLSEAKELLGPGTDTQSASLSHTLYALAHDQEFQEQIVRDCAAVGWPKDMASLEAIPTLRAAIKEGIRWVAAATAVLPRVTPPGGVVLAGRFIPGGTVISSSPTWYLHDKQAFPDPHNYRPSRWLDDEHKSEAEKALRNDYYLPFSKGPTTCIGNNFTYLALYISLSQILKVFKVTLSDRVPPYKEAKLEPRKEWVVAFPDQGLHITLEDRAL